LSERWWRRRKRRLTWFSDFFQKPSRLEKMMDEMLRPTSGLNEKRKPNKPYNFGFSMTLNHDPNPYIRRFGDTQRSCSSSEIREELASLVEVFEDDKEVSIVAELPGVRKEDIRIHVTQFNVTIAVDTPERSYYKEVTLPIGANPDSTVTTYKNGVLHLRLKRLVETQFFTR
jgi:HSP20 family protein